MAAKFMRQLDKMGRVVIPKDIRDELQLKDQHLNVYELESGRGIKVVKEKGKEEGKTLDRYGRVVIPVEIRQQLNWEEGKQVEIRVLNNEVVLNDHSQYCIVCQSDQSLTQVKGKYLCEECLEQANRSMGGRWSSVFSGLLHEYREHCRSSLTFEDPEDIHQARVKGRRLEALLQSLKVPKDHEIFDPLKEAHKLLGKVRESDVAIEAFIRREEKEENQKLAQIYRLLHQSIDEKRRKHRDELKKLLPEVISDDFYDSWEAFLKDELHNYVMIFKINRRLEQYEHSFNEAVDEFNKACKKKGRTSKPSLNALHNVRIESKYLRYIYRYLNEMYEENYKKQADYYEDIQDHFGEINDLKDWLKAFKKHEDQIAAKKKHIKAVKQQLQEDLAKRMDEVKIEKLEEGSSE
ncbi:CHAD domain-containing protein [Halobacillus sp. A5]|uniref:CHAD domain-containing protein n=1 Tax=Halobacillus sp. A5 TaxID=2880263 RepID=UPI0020A6C7C2|nr:CHAD domain-containing protein [Halobacillus sp. A5]MCP3028917.1 CHAD domain-containing protein [Halobacillus sp. A5]